MRNAGLLMIVGAALFLGLFFLPLWSIHLIAPQYPEGLGMNIYIDGLQGVSKNDISNINMLNHYIGMKHLPKAEDMWEFRVFPLVVGIMAAIGILIGILGMMKKVKPSVFLIWLVVMGILGILGVYDFNLWLVQYGSDLDPNASIKLLDESGKAMTYKPPLIGYQKMLNFDVYSLPSTGGYVMGVGFLLVFLAYLVGIKATKRAKAALVYMIPIFLGSSLLFSCAPQIEPIRYGEDECDACRMKIISRTHAAQLVSKKGKNYKFDATECMIRFMEREVKEEDMLHILSANYLDAGVLIDATKATFIISENIPSPMGAFLSTLKTREEAEKLLEEHGGELFTWEEVKHQLDKPLKTFHEADPDQTNEEPTD